MSDKFAKVPGGCKDVNIVTAAKESKRSKVIVIDLLNFARKPREYYDPKIVLKKDINGGVRIYCYTETLLYVCSIDVATSRLHQLVLYIVLLL